LATVNAARPFVVGGAGVEMLVPGTAASLAENGVTPEQDAEYMQAVRDGDVVKQQAMVDAARIKPRDVFYVGRAEVIRNPNDRDYQQIKKEHQEEYPNDRMGETTRFTMDKNGNRYIWRADYGMHNTIEPGIESREKVTVGQNEFNWNMQNADPITRDAEGNVIPLSQRFNPESNSTLYAAPIHPSQSDEQRGGRSDLPEGVRGAGASVAKAEGSGDAASLLARLDAGREKAVSAAVAESDWENYTPEQKIKAVNSLIRSVYLAAEHSLRAAFRGVGGILFTRGDEGSASARGIVGPEGRLQLVLTYDHSERIREAIENGAESRDLFNYAYDVAQEEIIHAADKVAAFRRWDAAGRPGTYEGFSNREALHTFNQINQARRDLQRTDPAAAQKIEEAMLASWEVYHNEPVEGLPGLVRRLEERDEKGETVFPPSAYLYELRRQLTQLKRQDFTTETGW
jgi:hypothetical protein